MSRNASKRSAKPPACSGRFDVIVAGVSAGGVELLLRLLPELPADFPVPLVVCLHAAHGTTLGLAELLDQAASLQVREAEDKEVLCAGRVYVAPGGYHLLVEREGVLSLSLDEPVRFARPSVDVLFESAAQAFRGRVLAVVLSGANDDGARGAVRIKAAGGMVVVQDPSTAVADAMPRATLAAVTPDHCVAPGELPALLQRLCTARGTP